jgi:hypothetical protein
MIFTTFVWLWHPACAFDIHACDFHTFACDIHANTCDFDKPVLNYFITQALAGGSLKKISLSCVSNQHFARHCYHTILRVGSTRIREDSTSMRAGSTRMRAQNLYFNMIDIFSSYTSTGTRIVLSFLFFFCWFSTLRGTLTVPYCVSIQH